MARPFDPVRRSLPYADWPVLDRQLWELALAEGNPLDDAGTAAHWSERTKQTNQQHYGRWLGWLDWVGELRDEPPAGRVTKAAVRLYHQHLESLGLAPRTGLSMLVGLKVTMQAMAPGQNWRWLQDVCNRFQRNAMPRHDKRAKMRPTAEIVAAALAEMGKLTADALSLTEALHYRDAMMLALLATRPLRVKNFTTLEIGRHLRPLNGTWLLDIPADETKTHQPISFLLPDALRPWFERYLAEVRPRFPNPTASPRLWLGQEGVMMDPHFAYHRITKLTRRLFGVAINPHLLRDCAASTLATESVELARAAAPLLGHRHFSTTERYYIQANNLDASRRFNAILASVKSSMKDY